MSYYIETFVPKLKSISVFGTATQLLANKISDMYGEESSQRPEMTFYEWSFGGGIWSSNGGKKKFTDHKRSHYSYNFYSKGLFLKPGLK